MNRTMHMPALGLGTLKRELQPAERRSRLEFNLQVALGYLVALSRANWNS